MRRVSANGSRRERIKPEDSDRQRYKEEEEEEELQRAPTRRGSKIGNMPEAKILQAIQNIDNYLIENANKTRGRVGMKIVKMMEMARNDLRSILDFLANKKLEKGSSLKYWISEVVEIAHDAYLLIDNRDPVLGFKFRAIHRASGEMRKCILQLGVEGVNTYPITYSSPPGDEDVVGLDEEVESVLRQSILSERTGLSAMCIGGMAGVGKTTLARKIFNDKRVVDRYETRVWIDVSGEPSHKEILMKLVLQLLHYKDQFVLLEEMEDADNETLQQMLYQHLQGKQFLIVLDDINKIPYFESISKALPQEDNKQSRVLLTSRFWSIDYRLTLVAEVYSMKPLDDNRSWQLFLKLLLFGNQQFPKRLEMQGREMLRMCDGLPLSIKEVATQFVIKRRDGSEWEELLESMDLSVTIAVLESIYHRWTPQLKLCFLCLSFFKKGPPIKTEKLVQVWTAGQVIIQEEKEDMDLEEAFDLHIYRTTDQVLRPTYADRLERLEGYRITLLKLIDESIVEVDMCKQHIKCFRISPSFHTLSIAKAEEELVCETLKKGKSNPPSSQEPRHRVIYCSRDEFNLFTDHDERLISLFFRGGGYFDARETYWTRFERLRTLDFEGFGLKMLPEIIGALTELRYLGLRDNYIQELPRSLGRLKNLEVLDIALNFTMEVLDIVWEIGSLRYLYMSDIICRKPFKIDKLKHLVTLTYISVNNWTYEVLSLEMMTCLRKLGIEEVDENCNLSKLFASLTNLRNLDCLILKGFRFRSMPSLHGLETLDHLKEIRLDGLITKLPSADTFPRGIRYLSLVNSRLDEDPMSELGKLDFLIYLKLKNAYTGQQMVIPSIGFPSLQLLCVEELWHLRNIQAETGIKILDKLEIKSCPYLENISEGMFKQTLKAVKMLTTRRLAPKIRKLGFLSKVKHLDIQP